MRMIYAATTDFTYVYDTTEEVIDAWNTAFFVGYLFGSLANLLHRWFNRQLLLVFCVMLIAIPNGFLPLYGSLVVAFVANFLSGLGSGAWDAGTHILQSR